MIAHIGYIAVAGGQELPCAVMNVDLLRYYDGDIEDLIVACKSKDDCSGPLDFVCENEEEAFSRLRSIVRRLYPGVRIYDKVQRRNGILERVDTARSSVFGY